MMEGTIGRCSQGSVESQKGELMTDPIDNWSADDKLDRKQSADFLTNYLSKRYALLSKHKAPDTFVLNVCAEWGFGKTFFLKRWKLDLEAAGFPVVYFDAWANDFSDDPLVGFIAEMDQALKSRYSAIPAIKRHIDQALAVGRKLIRPVGTAIAAVLAKKLSGYSLDQLRDLLHADDRVAEEFEDREENSKSDVRQDGGSDLAAEISKHAEVALAEHLSKKETIELFRKRLERLVEALNNEPTVELPMFIFVDELDRCRPTYAIELLEAIKHLFGVGGIYFIVATNVEQLGHSIKAVYGEQFDSERYLKRFFDQEYLLPSPDHAKFVRLLFERHALEDFEKIYPVIEDGIYPNATPRQALFLALANAFGLSLRDQEQVASTLQAVLLNWPNGSRVHLAYLLFLIIVKQLSSSLFKVILEGRPVDRADLMRKIQVLIGGDSKFRTTTLANQPHASVVTWVDVSELISHYIALAHTDVKELHNLEPNVIKFPQKITAVLIEDCPRMWSGDSPPSPLAGYATRVSQIGQLLVSRR